MTKICSLINSGYEGIEGIWYFEVPDEVDFLAACDSLFDKSVEDSIKLAQIKEIEYGYEARVFDTEVFEALAANLKKLGYKPAVFESAYYLGHAIVHSSKFEDKNPISKPVWNKLHNFNEEQKENRRRSRGEDHWGAIKEPRISIYCKVKQLQDCLRNKKEESACPFNIFFNFGNFYYPSDEWVDSAGALIGEWEAQLQKLIDGEAAARFYFSDRNYYLDVVKTGGDHITLTTADKTESFPDISLEYLSHRIKAARNRIADVFDSIKELLHEEE